MKTSHTAPGPHPQGFYSPLGKLDQIKVLVKIQDIRKKDQKEKKDTQGLRFQLFSMMYFYQFPKLLI